MSPEMRAHLAKENAERESALAKALDTAFAIHKPGTHPQYIFKAVMDMLGGKDNPVVVRARIAERVSHWPRQ